MAQEKMELDLELLSSSATKDDMLRRSNSAPLISGLGCFVTSDLHLQKWKWLTSEK
uniref:Uncharacterized protein n=1 Tax=Neovison vison TaxID=452646 RepID=A0A8C7EK39_NEOVI